MKTTLASPGLRLCLAIGASAGIGHVLFRSLTANLGAILGLATGVLAVATIVLFIFLLLAISTHRAAE